MTDVTTAADTRLGEPARVRYRGESPPDEAAFSQVEEGLYRATVTPEERGYRTAFGAEYAANYRPEYGRFGRSPALSNAVRTTGGQSFDADRGAEIARIASERSTRVRSVRDSWGWVPLLLGLLLFVAEVVTRRLQVYRGRTLLESGLQ